MNKEEKEGLNSIVSLMPTIIATNLVLNIMKELSRGIISPKNFFPTPTIDEFEKWMESIWNTYNRKQPPHYIAN